MAMALTRSRHLHHFGGHTGAPWLHIGHANGFPPAVYAPLAENLVPTYHTIGLGARPLWPDPPPPQSQTWHHLAADLIADLEALGAKGIIGVGHSLGGVTTLLAAVQRPDLFRSLVLLDPVLLPPRWLVFMRWMQRLRLPWQPPLVEGALRRRRSWPNRDAAYAYFAEKPLFAQWHIDALKAYVQHGTRSRPDGQVELIYPPEWEAHIFGSVPTDVWRFLPRLDTALPLLFVRGERSDTFRPEAQTHTARLLPQAKFAIVPGAGHMFPLERPAETAALIRAFVPW